jgi:CubicO group peptidase (beta-lactamase class C family)
VTEIQEKLAHACADLARGQVSLGVIEDGRVRLAAHSSEEHFIYAGCLAKLFTTTLVARAVSMGMLSLEARAADLIGVCELSERIDRITVRQLLNHTHGLDVSAIASVPRDSRGHIDLHALGAALSEAPPLHAPGVLHSYSNAGCWIAAAILERLTCMTFEALLVRWLLDPLGLRLKKRGNPFAISGDDAYAMCPSAGGSWIVSTPDVLEFARLHLATVESAHAVLPRPALLRDAPTALPGWSSELGACLGWKHYGEGWFGHHSQLAQWSAIVRINPERGRAIVVCATDVSAFLILARMFGRELPEYKRLSFPAPGDKRCSQQTVDSMIGIYRTAATEVSIHDGREGALYLQARERNANRSAPRLLKPMRDGVFLVDPPLPPDFSWIQLIQSGADGERYLWNGRQLWPRRQD